MPWEQDGGAVVAYYQLKKMNMLAPRDEHWATSKVPEEYDGSYLPWVNGFLPDSHEAFARLMYEEQIPLMTFFHIGHEAFEQIIDSVHDVGSKIVLWQTIHWPTDTILMSNRLMDIDKIVAPTEYAKRVFQLVRRIPPNNIEVIPHGVDTDRFYKHPTILKEKLGIRPEQKVILYSGRLGFWKGVHQIIPIMRPLAKAYDCVFIIRGGYFWGQEEGKRLAYVFERISTNNPNVIFLPEWQSPSYMEELFAMTDILVSNSGHEGFNVPLIEAQAVGAVPVTTALANHVEILGETGNRGILLEPRLKVGKVDDATDINVATHEQLLGAVKWLLENPEERDAMGMRGITNVNNRFRLEDVCKKWFELYDSLISKDYSMDDVAKDRVLNV